MLEFNLSPRQADAYALIAEADPNTIGTSEVARRLGVGKVAAMELLRRLVDKGAATAVPIDRIRNRYRLKRSAGHDLIDAARVAAVELDSLGRSETAERLRRSLARIDKMAKGRPRRSSATAAVPPPASGH